MAESSRPTSAALDDALALAREALAAGPAGLLTDFDGTLSPIVADPDAARLAAGADDALARLAERLAVVAIVTGRAPMDARRQTGVPSLLVAGNHGTEWLEPNADAPAESPNAEAIRARVRAVLARVPDLDGVTIEDKGLSATVHYRRAAHPPAARDAVMAAVGEPGGDMTLRQGKMSLELRPRDAGDKGVAVDAIIRRFRLRGVVVMGDDLTDLDMFRAVAAVRAAGALRAAIIGVGGADGELPQEVADASDAVLADPHVVAEFLGRLAAD